MDADGRGYISLLSIDNTVAHGNNITIIILFAVLVILLLLGGYFAGAETAFASVSKIRIKTLADSKDRKAKKALFITENFDKALITMLIGNNISHIAFSAIATLMAENYFHNITVTVSTLISTIVVFFIAEMLPKSYAKSNCEKVALRYASSLKFLMTILTPLSFIFSNISKFISKIFIKNMQPTVTEEELQDIIETMDDQGVIDEDKSELVQNALEFDDVTAADIITSRVDLTSIDIDDDIEDILDKIKNTNYSRFPVYDKNIDNIVGILRTRRFLKAYIKNKEMIDIKSLLSTPYFEPSTTRIDDLFERMTQHKCYMAVITDEYGGTMGIVTIEDIVEELVGDIWDESDEVIENIIKISDDTYRVLSDVDIDDFLDEVEIENYSEEFERKSFGVWCGEMLETMPKEKDNFQFNRLDVTVEKVEHNRIISLIVKVLPEAKEAEDND